MGQSGTSSHRFAVFGRQWAIFGTFADQACSSPTFAKPKRPTLGRESPQTCKPPTHLATSAWQGIMGPCNAQCRALGLAPKSGLLGTLHIPQQPPPLCPALWPRHTLSSHKGGKIWAKSIQMLSHHNVGGQLFFSRVGKGGCAIPIGREVLTQCGTTTPLGLLTPVCHHRGMAL